MMSACIDTHASRPSPRPQDRPIPINSRALTPKGNPYMKCPGGPLHRTLSALPIAPVTPIRSINTQPWSSPCVRNEKKHEASSGPPPTRSACRSVSLRLPPRDTPASSSSSSVIIIISISRRRRRPHPPPCHMAVRGAVRGVRLLATCTTRTRLDRIEGGGEGGGGKGSRQPTRNSFALY